MNSPAFKISSDIEAGVEGLPSFDLPQLIEYQHMLMSIGSKDKPMQCEYGQFHPDCSAVEWAMGSPAQSVAEFLEKEMQLRDVVQSTIGAKLVGYDYVEYDRDMLQHPDLSWFTGHANTIGCDPDFYQGEERKVPLAVKKRGLKEFGLHIHADLRPDVLGNHDYCSDLVRDYHKATAIFHEWGHPTESPWFRHPECYRLKPYGIEYRSFGSSIINDPGKLALLLTITFDFFTDHWKGGQFK